MEDLRGLSKQEAAQRLGRFGPNALPEPGSRLLRLILRQFRGIFNLLLIVAAGVTFALGEPIDGSFILFFVILGTALNVYQEYKSGAAVEKLKSYLERTITVVRDGEASQVPIEQIVPGDLLKLQSGDIVPADAIVRQSGDLLVDETTFTGESIPVAKSETAVSDEQAADENRLLQGVVVISGNALAEVVATGEKTRLAGIAQSAGSQRERSELYKGIDRISKFILISTLGTVCVIVLLNILLSAGEIDIPHYLIFGIALAVTVIPEALPLVLTFSLSRGALQFAKHDVIVKRLSSVQDLGSVNLLCTGKTGTITENHLVFADEYVVKGSKYHPLVLARLAAHNINEQIPEPFDCAADEALSDEQRKEVETFEVLEEEAFDPALRSNGAVLKCKSGGEVHIRRGSPEYFFEQNVVKKEQVGEWLLAEEKKGHRVLGVSYDEGDGAKFGGFVSFVDRLKSTTKETIRQAKQLNVDITIITGDALMVAESVGREAGLVTDAAEVMLAEDFFALSEDEQLKRIDTVRVFARTTPEQKLQLIELLKQRHTVGFLGEGINDVPALKTAHVSMVVQSASDVARETADIILLKNDLRVIVEGIRRGRETHANTMKYIRATLVSNFGNFYAVSIGSLFISFLPMLPKQLLLLNLLSDFPMMAVAFDRVSKREVAHPQRYDFRSLYSTFLVLGFVSTVFDFIYFALFFRISPQVLQTNWFIASVITELLIILSIRSMQPIWKAGWPAPPIIYLSAGAILLSFALPIIPWTAAFFEFITPSAAHLGLIVGLAVLYLIVADLVKRPLARYLAKRQKRE